MNLYKHLVLWSSLSVLGLLGYAAVEENFLRQWRSIQSSLRADEGPIDVRLRQVVVPRTGVTDRCVSCHVGMAPGEPGLSGNRLGNAHRPVFHDPAAFGCTTCHGGQGRATEMADAHGEVPFWPEPKLPLEYSYAGCGSCHTHIRIPNQAQLVRGSRLVEQFDCLTCHRIDNRGGTLRTGESAGVEAPDLSSVGLAGVKAAWFETHLRRQRQAAKGPWKTSFGDIAPADRRDIETFLESRVGNPRLMEAKALFHSLGCRGCHKIGGVGGDDGPDLTQAGLKDPGRLDFGHVTGKADLVHWHAEHLRKPFRVVPGSQMPDQHLGREQVDLLTFYLMSLRRGPFPDTFWPKDRIRAERLGEREFAVDGSTLFGTFCAGCHGSAGEGRRYPQNLPFPAVGNKDFLAVASDEFLTTTIRKGRPGRRMPAWGEKEGGLRPEEVVAVAAHLRRLGGGPDPTLASQGRRRVQADPAPGRELFARYCAGCHGPAGEGLEGPALKNPGFLAAADDGFLVETISRGRDGTPMPGFRRAALSNPVLAESEVASLAAFIRSWEGASR